MDTNQISIIVAVDNHFSLLDNFFNHILYKVNITNCEIIIVIDGCRNVDVLDYINEIEQEHRNVRKIVLEKKVGYSIANNIGVELACSEYLLFINSDVFPEYESIQDMLKYLKSNPDTGIAQGLLLYPQTNLIQSTGHIFGEYFNRHALINRRVDTIKDIKVIYRQAVTSAFYLIKRELFTSLGGFDPFYYNCWDGMELSLKVTKSKLNCVCLTECKAFHATGGARDFLDNETSQQSAYFWSKWGQSIKNDLIDCLREQFINISEKQYICINCSSIRNYMLYITDLEIDICTNLDVESRFGNSINFYFELPFVLLTTPYSLLFFANKFTDIASNKNWIQVRNNPNDIVIDTHGNVIKLINLI